MGVFKRDERLQDLGVQIAVPGERSRRSLHEAFEHGKRQHRTLLMPFLVCGYPDGEGFLRCVDAAAQAGADVLEIGVPFSDPIMDGPAIAGASSKVLQAGMRIDGAMELLSRASSAFGGPIVAMTYYNLLLRRGLKEFASSLSSAGVAGAIVPDLTPEESFQWSVGCQQAGVSTVYLAAVTSTNERLALIAQATEGFVYAASTLGVTGERAELSDRARGLVERLREVTDKPVAVGIGVSTRGQAAEVATFADGVIVGSALVRAIDDSAGNPAAGVRALVADLRSALG